MAFVSDLFDQLRDILNDASDTQVPFATKKLYLNRGIARLWPRVWLLDEQGITLVAGQREYNLSIAVAKGHVVSVEYLPEGEADDAFRFTDYDIIPGDEDELGYFRLPVAPSSSSDLIRLKVALPVPQIVAASYAAAQSEMWAGPDRAMGLPVLYALGLIAARRLDDRQDHTRYSTTQALNGVTDNDVMTASAMWFGQFAEELADIEMPLPIAKD